MKNSNDFQNILYVQVSLERLSSMSKCRLYLEGTDEVCLFVQNTYLVALVITVKG